MIRFLLIAFMLLGSLSACGSGTEQSTSEVAAQRLASIFGRDAEISQLTATRASLQASGFDQPLLVGTLTRPVPVQAGLLLATTRRGVEFWRGADGSLVKTDRGILRGTVGVPFDLYGAETAATRTALSGGNRQGYSRVYRHLNALNQLDVTRFSCNLSGPVPETIVVFDRQHRTHKFHERCIADTSGPKGITREINNIYWKDPNRLILWKSEQWISDEIGTILLERVFE